MLLLHEARDEDPCLIVLGGLVPEILTAGHDHAIPDHLGTTDVDVLLITQVDGSLDLGGVERALKRLKFEPDDEDWRWRGRISGLPVKIEFLCDPDEEGEGEVIRPGGCEKLAAVNLRGTGYVARDFTFETLSADFDDGARVTVQARFAGLCGYLLSKCVARYHGARDAGPSGYFAQAVQVDPDIDETLARSDAVDAVARFFAELASCRTEEVVPV